MLWTSGVEPAVDAATAEANSSLYFLESDDSLLILLLHIFLSCPVFRGVVVDRSNIKFNAKKPLRRVPWHLVVDGLACLWYAHEKYGLFEAFCPLIPLSLDQIITANMDSFVEASDRFGEINYAIGDGFYGLRFRLVLWPFLFVKS